MLHYANEKERQQLIDDLSDETVLNTILLKSGSSGEYDIKFPTGGSASLPQAVLLQKAEEACHKAILGQTLTSDTSAQGGSLAQAKVHAGVQADVVMKIAESVADILNQQLVPAILQANFGRVQGLPIPELRCKLPQAVASIERAQFLKTALEIPGMKVTKTEAYEYLNLTQPSETDEVFEAQNPNAMGGGPGGGGFPGGGMGAGFPGAGGKETELPDAGAKDEVVTSARAQENPTAAPRARNEAIKAWLAPIKKNLSEARSGGASLSELREQISAWRPDTRALAGALAENIADGLLGRKQGNVGAGNANTEEVAAENPYGCNQHGHGWVDACPYGGGGNGMAGKSALQIAGGAENVNPDDDEEEKKEAEAKAEAERKAKEEAEAAKKAKKDAEKKEIVAKAEEVERRWNEIAADFEKKYAEYDDLSDSKEHTKAKEALSTLQWYKDAIASWKTKLDTGSEPEQSYALNVLKGYSDDAVMAQKEEIFNKYAQKVKSAFKKLEKLKKPNVAKEQILKTKGNGVKTKPKLQQTARGRNTVADIEAAANSLPRANEAVHVCAKMAEGKGGLINLWNNAFTKEQQKKIVQYTDGYYEAFNYEFRHGIDTEETQAMRSIFDKVALPGEVTVSRVEKFGGMIEYSKDFENLQGEYEFSKISREEGVHRVYEYLKARLDRGEDIIRASAAPTSTSAMRDSESDFCGGIHRLIHLPKGARALCVAPVSYHENNSFDPGDTIDIKKYQTENSFGEREILIAPSAKFRTLGVKLSGDSLYIEEELILE